ncbi:MAG: NUDIX hydrolase [Sphingomicrobium sp.]
MWEGRFITAVRDGRWEYVRRARGIRAVVILAETDAGEVLLVEQHRVPIGGPCLELPAGLIGDDEGGEADTVEAAAVRELVEETGYRPERVERLGDYFSSPGMVAEGFTLVRASGLTRVGDGGGTGGENIIVHRVQRDAIADFVATKRREGVGIDVRLLLLLGADYSG